MASTRAELDAKPGDLIEIFHGTFEHWAVYIGGDEVVHLVPQNTTDASGPVMLMLLESNIAKVKRQKIWEVVGSYRFVINNLLDDEYQPHEHHIIVNDACSRVGWKLQYSVTSYNCEHFATELRYGKPQSRQVRRAAVIGGAAVVGVGLVALGAVLIRNMLENDDEDDDDYI